MKLLILLGPLLLALFSHDALGQGLERLSLESRHTEDGTVPTNKGVIPAEPRSLVPRHVDSESTATHEGTTVSGTTTKAGYILLNFMREDECEVVLSLEETADGTPIMRDETGKVISHKEITEGALEKRGLSTRLKNLATKTYQVAYKDRQDTWDLMWCGGKATFWRCMPEIAICTDTLWACPEAVVCVGLAVQDHCAPAEYRNAKLKSSAARAKAIAAATPTVKSNPTAEADSTDDEGYFSSGDS